VTGFGVSVISGVVAYQVAGPYGEKRQHDPRVRRFYDPTTDRLRLLVYDADGDGRFDTWSFMDGERVLRMEFDEDEDGHIDRREEYSADSSTPGKGDK
jgi:hypothetical protein